MNASGNGGIDNRAGARISSGGVVKANERVDNSGEIEQYVKR
ncbi:hypothetical protein [Burkholderia sp. BCC0405]|nr:hypothetical protein [Burkholderia sp. BCC0405]